MSLVEAVQAVCGWLALTSVNFRLVSAHALGSGFGVSLQVYPQNITRTFEVLPEECAGCWKVVEV